MKCCKCCRFPVENNLAIYPIEPKGTKDRKWCCTECGITPEERKHGQGKTPELQAIIEFNRRNQNEN